MLRTITRTACSRTVVHGQQIAVPYRAVVTRYSTSTPPPTSTSTSTSTQTPTSTTTPTPTPTTATTSTAPTNEGGKSNNNNNDNNNNNQGGGKRNENKGGGGAMGILLGGFVIATAATGGMFYKWQTDPLFKDKLEQWGVLSTIESVREKYVSATSTPAPIRTREPTSAIEPAPEPELEQVPVPAPVQVEHEIAHVAAVPIEAIEIDLIPVVSITSSDLPVEIVPLHESSTIEIPNEATEVIPVEIIEIIQPEPDTIAPQEVSPQREHEHPSETPEGLLRQLIEEFTDKQTNAISTPTINQIDFQALLSEQAAQLEALKATLHQYQTEQHQALDYKTQAQEAAYRDVLSLHDRVNRKELSEKLAQLQAAADAKLTQVRAELKAQYEQQRQGDRDEAQAHYQQQLEESRTEIHRNMEEALSAAVENAQAQYSVRLAEEINNFDSKLTSELANEDAKYTASSHDRMRVVDKLRGEVMLLEAALVANTYRLKESIHLHNISAALYELGTTTLASPTRTSFVTELEKLELASKALPSGDPVIATVAEVLRPIAAGGVASYNELTERFKTVLARGRQAALVPEGGGMMGNLMAAVASKLIIPAKGPVVGDTPEAIFAKAEYYLEHGELNEAVTHLSLLRGMPASIVRDWVHAASDRLIVENSLKALHAHVVVLAHQHNFEK